MNRRLLVLAALAAFAVPQAVCYGQGELTPIPVGRHVEFLATELGPKLGPTASSELMDYARRWDSLDLKTRDWLEKLICVLRDLNDGQLDSIFKNIEAKPESQRRDLVKKTFDDLTAGVSIPAGAKEPYAVCVVIVGAGIDHKFGFAEMETTMPRIAYEIAPFGTVLKALSSGWMGLGMRSAWTGELMTGKKMGGIIPDNNIYKFTCPTVLHYFRKASGAKQGKAWMITCGDRENIIFDHLPMHPQWDDLYRPIAITSVHLKRYDEAVRDHFLSQLRSVKNPITVQKNLFSTLTPGKLRLDTDFDDVAAREIIKDAIAARGGNSCDNNAFLQELAVRLFRSSMNPEIVFVRFGPDWRVEDKKRRDLMPRKMRDDDEAAFNIWTAFRKNPVMKRNGYFIIISEGHPGAVVVGPDIPAGQVLSSRLKIEDMLPTIAHMLHFDWAKFTEGIIKTSGPFEALFPKK